MRQIVRFVSFFVILNLLPNLYVYEKETKQEEKTNH